MLSKKQRAEVIKLQGALEKSVSEFFIQIIKIEPCVLYVCTNSCMYTAILECYYVTHACICDTIFMVHQ